MPGHEPPPPDTCATGRGTFASAPSVTGFEDAELEVIGVIRLRMPEEDIDFPLWDDNGLLPEEPELLVSALGISPALVAELQAWGARWNDRRSRTQDQFDAHREHLHAEASALVVRMRSELHAGLHVVVELR